jgi:hypothetical protein
LIDLTASRLCTFLAGYMDVHGVYNSNQREIPKVILLCT